MKKYLKMRKVAAIAACLAGSATLFAQETGVVINGVTWATRNVGAPGTFAAAPESSGMFYQWNSKIGWSATDPLVSTNGSTWNSSWNGNGATSWEAANNPCPTGWLVPTEADFDKLLDATKVTYEWITVNGINGGRFTDKVTNKSIFVPVGGGRLSDGSIFNYGFGYCWSNSVYTDVVYSLLCISSDVSINGIPINFAMPVRCVKNGSTGINDVSADTENTKVTGYFDILGRKLTEEPTKGIYIIRYDNGKAKKMMK